MNVPEKNKVPNIAVLDSGIGGLSILNTLQEKLDSANFYYVADYEYFPYGLLSAQAISSRMERLFDWLKSNYKIDLFVIACNTASTSALLHLREKFFEPIVGVVPPIKVAATVSQSKVIAVLATEQTAFNEYTKKLVMDFAGDCEVKILGSRELVLAAEAKIHGKKVDLLHLQEILHDIIADKRVDAVALSCTHFPFLIEELESVGLKPKFWTKPNDGVAARVQYLLQEMNLLSATKAPFAGKCHLFLANPIEFMHYEKAFARLSGLEVSAVSLP